MTLNLEEFRRAVYEGSIAVIENINAVAERQERERQRKWYNRLWRVVREMLR
jgi:hypothetical protein